MRTNFDENSKIDENKTTQLQSLTKFVKTVPNFRFYSLDEVELRVGY